MFTELEKDVEWNKKKQALYFKGISNRFLKM